MEYSNYCAEVMNSSLFEWNAQSWQWDYSPPFGSLVTITDGEKKLFGIVYKAETGSIDPVHQPYPHQKNIDELLSEYPHIFEFLRTTFSCIVVGYTDKGNLRSVLAPTPAKIHSFVGIALPEDEDIFFRSADFFYLLSGNPIVSGIFDELLLALISHYYTDSRNTERLNLLLNRYTTTFGHDYKRLAAFINRISTLIAH